MPSYPVLEIAGDALGLEIALSHLSDWGCLGTEEIPPAGNLRAFFPQETDVAEVARDLRRRLSGIDCREAAPQPVADWLAAWKASFTGFALGESHFILPTWLPEPSVERLVLRLDPEQAFGTGTHDTTRLAATLLERIVRPGDRVIDLGAGTGILAMVAALRGAREVTAIEPDEDAARCARENVARNGLARIRVETAGYESYERLEADVIVANITRPILEEAILRMEARILVLSGLLADEVDDFQSRPTRFRTREVWTSGDWAALVMAGPVMSRERRFHVQDLEADSVVLASDEAHHLIHVLRLGPGAEVSLFDGHGRAARAIVLRITDGEVRLEILGVEPSKESSLSLTLAVAPPKGDRMSFLVQKLAELGVGRDHSAPDRSSGPPGPLERYRRIALEASKQSGRSRLPEIAEPRKLDEVLNEEAFIAVAHPGAPPLSRPPEGVSILAIVGPEGGWSEGGARSRSFPRGNVLRPRPPHAANGNGGDRSGDALPVPSGRPSRLGKTNCKVAKARRRFLCVFRSLCAFALNVLLRFAAERAGRRARVERLPAVPAEA